MKKLLLSLIGILFACTSIAQNTLVASLSHGTNITYYYGGTALKQAVEAAAESGDIINLSGGIFEATDITKAITLRGAGIASDEPTYINGEFAINIPSTIIQQFTMEGINCRNKVSLTGAFNNPYFVKSQIQSIELVESTDAIKNIMVVSSKIPGGIYLKGSSTIYLVNSFSGDISREESATSAAVIATNCVLRTYTGGMRFYNSQVYNCIFVAPGYTDGILSETCTATNCASTGSTYHKDIFDKAVKTDCQQVGGTVFKDEVDYELNDAVKESLKGNDGSEMGMYGGLQPYNPKPSYPLISSMNVSPQTNEQGNLNVEVNY